MKRAAFPLLLLAILAASGCSTLANRRELFRPATPSGPYNTKLESGQISHNKYGR